MVSKKIAVTGSKGFLGTHLISFLKTKENISILRLDKNLLDISDDQNITCDLSQKFDVTESLKGVDTVIHMAARVHIMKDTSQDPLGDFRKINVEATRRLAEQAEKAGVRRFIFISSIKVNGESSKNGYFRADGSTNPEDPYAVSKKEAEDILLNFATISKMDVVIIRPPLIYGQGVKGNFLSLINLFKKNIPIIFLKTKNKRRYVSVHNVVDFIHYCIDHPKAVNQVFLVGDADSLSTSDLFEKIAKASHKKIFLIPINERIVSTVLNAFGLKKIVTRLMSDLDFDISKNKTLLDWEPKYTLEEELKKIFHINQG